MRSKRVLWLNGKNSDSDEVALPEAVVPEIGLEGAKRIGAWYEKELIKWIENVRAYGCREVESNSASS